MGMGSKMSFLLGSVTTVLFLFLILTLSTVDATAYDAVGDYDPDEFEGFEPINSFEDVDSVDEVYEAVMAASRGGNLLDDDDEFADEDADEDPFSPQAKAGGTNTQQAAANGGVGSSSTGAGGRGTTIKRAGRVPDRLPARFTVWEYCGVVVIIVYAIAYLLGRQENQKIATAWSACFVEFFEEQFAECGPATDQPREVTGSSDPLFKESQNEFLFYATGRRFCQGCLVRLQLKARHDLFARLLGLLNLTQSIGDGSSFPSRDTVTLEVVMNAEDMDRFVFACAQRKDLKAMHSSSSDLKNYTGMSNSDSLPESMALLTDCQDIIEKILHPPVIKAINEFSEYFCSMHFSDQNTEPIIGQSTIPPKVLRFKLYLPKVQEMSKLTKLMHMSVHFIDHIAKEIKLSQQNRAKAVERRKELAGRLFRSQHESRQEEMARRKTEKLRRERTAYEMMTAEQKVKYDAKEEKRKAKALQKSKMKMKRV